jgi:hypothetical protein
MDNVTQSSYLLTIWFASICLSSPWVFE